VSETTLPANAGDREAMGMRGPGDRRRHGLEAAGEALGFGIGGLLLGRRFTEALRDMRRAQWLTPAELQARAGARLAGLLRHAAEQVPFYRDTYRRLGLAPDALRLPGDLATLPVVSKTLFREQPAERFLAADLPPFARFESWTSGSVGEPLAFYLDRAKMPVIFACHLFYDSWYGLRPFDRGVRITTPGPPAPALPADMPLALRVRQLVSRRLQGLYERLTLRKILVWGFDDRQAEEIHRRLEAFRPAHVYGYASNLATVAEILLRLGRPLSRPPRAVVAIGDTLSPLRRHLIESYFRAPVNNRYGLREQGYWCAQSCPEAPEHFHVNTEMALVELVGEDGTPAAPGEIGRLLVTDLWNHTMPFIRYDTGDLGVAVPGPCPCGRGFPRLGPIEGRSSECLRTPSGKVVSPLQVSQRLFKFRPADVAAVRHYQLVWEPPDRARLLIVPTERLDEAIRTRLRDDLAWLLGGEVAVAVETVPAIPMEPSGKRPVIKVMPAPASTPSAGAPATA
jgi:phenylacetate-CoA ligase